MRHEYKHIINYGDYLALKSRLSIFMQTDRKSTLDFLSYEF